MNKTKIALYFYLLSSCITVLLLVVALMLFNLNYREEAKEIEIENQIIQQEIAEEKALRQEESISYKYFVRGKSYISEKLGKVIPNTSFNSDWQIVSHGGDFELESEYVKVEGLMPYILYKPTCVEPDEKLPLIVYFHGASEKSNSVKEFEKIGFPKALSEWKFDGFHAYILCLQNAGGYWKGENKKDAIMDVIKTVQSELPIDEKRISIVGHSSGGGGAMYINARSNGYFCAVVPISAVMSTPDEKNLCGAKIRAYLANGDGTGNLKVYFDGYLRKVVEKEQCFVINSTHLDSSEKAFKLDANKDNKSDLMEWILMQKRED